MECVISRLFFFDTSKSTLICLNESFNQTNSTMVVYRSFNNFNIFFCYRNSSLDDQLNILLDPIGQIEEFRDFRCTCPKIL